MTAQPQVRITAGGTPLGDSGTNGIGLFQAMLAAPLVAVNQRWPNVLHAVDSSEICSAWPNGTVTAPCGARRLRVLASGPFVVEWPPYVDGMPEGKSRCRECHELTGRKRPRSRWVAKKGDRP